MKWNCLDHQLRVRFMKLIVVSNIYIIVCILEKPLQPYYDDEEINQITDTEDEDCDSENDVIVVKSRSQFRD